MKTPLKLTASALALASLGACGITGDLKRPDPLWGEPAAETQPAELPETRNDDRPALPPRSTTTTTTTPAPDTDTPPNSEEELLGGPNG